ncbi:MAG: signal recognition particle protein [Acidobacteriota bacterium]
MFSALTQRLSRVLDRIRAGGRVTEADLDEALREIRLALLEADVSFKVAKEFLARVREKALGEDVIKSLTPGQQVVRVVRDEMTELLGGSRALKPLSTASRPPSVYMIVGLQGSGKTTTVGKLGRWLKAHGRHPLVVPVDLQRPAAVLQAIQVAKNAGVAAFEHDGSGTPVLRAQEGVQHARERGFDVVLLDTAGRLHIDDALMSELSALETALRPDEILYVADAMTGQDAVRSAEAFAAKVALSGVILTKVDGDARGGAAISVTAVTGVPIRFAGVGEKLDALESFNPDQMASRILGMGDVLALIQRAESAIDRDEAEKLAQSVRKSQFTLEDFRGALRQMKRLGPLEQLLGMIPGMKLPPNMNVDPKEFTRLEAIIDSMTPLERRSPQTINGARRKRIARGSGTQVHDVNKLLKQFADMQRMMKTVGAAQRGGKMARLFGR